MNRKIFDHTNPFTVPEGYFDTLQDRIMTRVQTEEKSGFRISRFRFNFVEGFALRTLVAAAACILFIFAGAALYTVFTDRQPITAELAADDEFYQWVYVSDDATLLAESLDIDIPEDFIATPNDYFEENDAIISFLERDNISVVAIAMLMLND